MDETYTNFSTYHGQFIHESWTIFMIFEVLNILICTITFVYGLFIVVAVFCAKHKEVKTNSNFEIQASAFILLRCFSSGTMSFLLLFFNNLIFMKPVDYVILIFTSLKPIHQVIGIALALNPIALQKLLHYYNTLYEKFFYQLIPPILSIFIASYGFYTSNAYSIFIIATFTLFLVVFNSWAYWCSSRFNLLPFGSKIALKGIFARLMKSVLDLLVFSSGAIISLIFYVYGENIEPGTSYYMGLILHLTDTIVPIFLLFLDLVNIFYVDHNAANWKDRQFRKICRRERVGPTMRRTMNYSASPNDHPVFSVNVV